jgi:hypothetical protein
MIKLGQRRDQPWSSVTESSGLSATGWSLVLSGKPTYFDDGWFDPDDLVSVKPDCGASLDVTVRWLLGCAQAGRRLILVKCFRSIVVFNRAQMIGSASKV